MGPSTGGLDSVWGRGAHSNIIRGKSGHDGDANSPLGREGCATSACPAWAPGGVGREDNPASGRGF